MRTEKVNLAIYADASYFLMYRQVFFDIMGSIGHSNSNVEWLRFVSKGVSSKQAEALSNPVSISVRNMYNPLSGLRHLHHAGNTDGHHPADAADRHRYGRGYLA